MQKIFKQLKSKKTFKSLKSGIRPVKVELNNGNSLPEIHFSDGSISPGSCIHCIKPKCIEYSESELQLDLIKDFPMDRNNHVCPTNAIQWPIDSACPIINNDYCISCGICVSRCPVYALTITDRGVIINDSPNDNFILQDELLDEANFNRLLKIFSKIQTNGCYFTETDKRISTLYKRINSLIPHLGSQFPNHLSRNLLISIGIKTAMRRRGDTYIRMDLIAELNEMIGTGEVEFSNQVLDAPRNILDDVAILIARYEINKNSVIPIIVCLSLPNQRSEYWQIIQDIFNVLKIKINSVTLGVLIVLVWSKYYAGFTTNDILYIEPSKYSIKEKVESLLGRKLNISEGYPGFIESLK